MKLRAPRLRHILMAAVVFASLGVAYWAGYRNGLAERGPDHRALMVVRRTPGSPTSSGTSATWFDVSQPGEAARLRKEEARLKAIGAEYYVAKGQFETSLRPEPDPRRVNSHR